MISKKEINRIEHDFDLMSGAEFDSLAGSNASDRVQR